MPPRKRSKPGKAKQHPLDQKVNEGLRLYSNGDSVTARAIAREVLMENPRHLRGLGLLAMCAEHIASFGEAIEAADRALELKPEDSLLLLIKARAMRMTGKTDDALALFDRAIAADPSSEAAATGKCTLLLALNRPEEAAEVMNPFADLTRHGHQAALALARIARHNREYKQGIAHLRTALDNPNLLPAARGDLLILLGEFLDKSGEHDAAFDAVTEAHAIRPSRFDRDAHRRAVDKLIKAASPERLAKVGEIEPPDDGPAPIFVLGYPRSGTTLVERILGAHPDVHAAGELDSLHNIISETQRPMSIRFPHLLQEGSLLSTTILRGIARRYRARLPEAAAGSPCVTDKMPSNIMHMHVIAHALPDAKIVLCDRDPRDTAVSCYFQQFGSMIDWTDDLTDIACYFEDAHRVVTHFTETRGIEIVRVRYESLVSEPEPVIRELLASLGLSWHDHCLAPHKQVGDARTRSVAQVLEPINTSAVARWKRYERQLGPVLERLTALATG